MTDIPEINILYNDQGCNDQGCNDQGCPAHYATPRTAPPPVAVPEEKGFADAPPELDNNEAVAWLNGYHQCRDDMLSAAPPSVAVPEGQHLMPSEFLREYLELLEASNFKAIHKMVRRNAVEYLLAATPEPVAPDQDNEDEESVAESAYWSAVDIIEPYVQRPERPNGALPASLVESVQILLDHWLATKEQDNDQAS